MIELVYTAGTSVESGSAVVDRSVRSLRGDVMDFSLTGGATALPKEGRKDENVKLATRREDKSDNVTKISKSLSFDSRRAAVCSNVT